MKFFCVAAMVFYSFIVSTLVCAQTKLDLEDALVVLNSSDQRYWEMDKTNEPIKQPLYPVDLIREQVSGCVSIGFFIEADGTTSGYRILKSSVIGGKHSAKQKKMALAMFSKAALESLVRVRFVAGRENPSKRRAFSQIPYSYSASRYDRKMHGNCTIPDLAIFLKFAGQEGQGK